MYCKYCGKQTEGNADICGDCYKDITKNFGTEGRTEQFGSGFVKGGGQDGGYMPYGTDGSRPASSYNVHGTDPHGYYGAVREYPPRPAGAGNQPVTNSYGWGKGLASVLLSVASIFFAALFVASFEAQRYDYTGYYYPSSFDYRCLIAFLLGLAAVVCALIFGIQAIVRFSQGRKAGAKPVASLVLGIIGTSISGYMVLIYFIFFTVVLASV